MQLDAVEAGRLRVLGSLLELRHDAGQLLRLERPRGHHPGAAAWVKTSPSAAIAEGATGKAPS